MVPQIDSLLRGVKFTTEQILMPELESKFARTQALALLQTIDILRDRVARQHEALLDETAALRSALRDAREAVAGHPAIPAGTRDEVARAVDGQLRRAYPLHHDQRTIAGLEQERLDLRTVHVRLMQALCDGAAFDAADLAVLRQRLRAAYASTYGYSVSFVPVWAD